MSQFHFDGRRSCEHCDELAPAGKRFCSMECEECEQTEQVGNDCAGICDASVAYAAREWSR